MNTQNAVVSDDDSKAGLDSLIQSIGLEYSAEFVPFSRSRNAKEKDKSLNWIVTIKRGNVSLSTDYMQGVGHIPNYSHYHSRLVVYNNAVNEACETGKSRIIKHKNAYDAAQGDSWLPRITKIPTPDLKDVLHSLILDSESIDYANFEDWAGTFGYSHDSRSAEKIYRQCLEIGLKLRSMIGESKLTELRDAFQDY